MPTDYDQIAEQYREAKEHPWRHRVETHSMMKLIGPLDGEKVVDLACGEGFFTRRLRKAGAAEVVGSDISHEMIALARAQEESDPLGIEFLVEDAREPGSRHGFDLAVAAWLLVYARTRDELGAFCRGIATRLRSGGRLVTLTNNPDLYSFAPRPDYRKYGMTVGLADHEYDGAPITWTIYLGSETIEIENYHMPREVIAAALAAAGFRDVRFHALELSPAPGGIDEGAYWDDLLRRQPFVMIDAVKQ